MFKHLLITIRVGDMFHFIYNRSGAFLCNHLKPFVNFNRRFIQERIICACESVVLRFLKAMSKIL